MGIFLSGDFGGCYSGFMHSDISVNLGLWVASSTLMLKYTLSIFLINIMLLSSSFWGLLIFGGLGIGIR